MPTIRLSKAELVALEPCGLPERLALFGRRKYLTAAQALDAGASVDELLWVAGRLGHTDLCARFAMRCAQEVAHLNDAWAIRAARAADAAADAAWAMADHAAYLVAFRAAASAVSAAGYAAMAAGWSAGATAKIAARRRQREIFLEIFN